MSDGIIKTSELPKIIPPLPTGDTKDLKVWQDYWKQHDEKIRQDATEKVLKKVNNWMIGMPESIREPIYQKIQSLRAGKDGE